jgi:opacity protein-like surface antigen
MRKIAFFFLLPLFTAMQAEAQEFRLGLTASPVISWFSANGNDVDSDGPRLGFQYGLMVEPTLGGNERYALSTGLMINMVGGFLTAGDDSLVYNSTLRVQYLELPLAAKLRTNEINYVSYYGLFGLTPGVNIKARYDLKDGNGDFIEDMNGDPIEDVNLRGDDLTDKYNLFNLSLTLGAGAEYSITETTTITAGITFQNGFVNVYKSSLTDETIQMKQFVFRLGVMF